MFSTLQSITRLAGRLSSCRLVTLSPLETHTRNKFFNAKDVMTNNEINVYKRLFEDMDSNKDGLLTKDELKKGLKDFADHWASEKELNEAIEILDADKKDTVGFEEFIGYIAWTKQIKLEDTIKSAFESVDENKDGLINKEEMWRALERLGIKTVSESGVKKVMAATDQDKDGSISLEEFRRFFYENNSK